MKQLPTWEDFNAPVLSVLSDGVVRTLRELRRDVTAVIGLTDEQVAEVLPSGQPRADNRIGWAASYLNRVDALNRPTRGRYEITAFGRELLAKYADCIAHADKAQYVARAKVKRLSFDGVKRLRLPLPLLEEQDRILAALDSFDALANDIWSGLAAELAARCKRSSTRFGLSRGRCRLKGICRRQTP